MAPVGSGDPIAEALRLSFSRVARREIRLKGRFGSSGSSFGAFGVSFGVPKFNRKLRLKSYGIEAPPERNVVALVSPGAANAARRGSELRPVLISETDTELVGVGLPESDRPRKLSPEEKCDRRKRRLARRKAQRRNQKKGRKR